MTVGSRSFPLIELFTSYSAREQGFFKRAKGETTDQVKLLGLLADLRLKKHDYLGAAHLLNAAIAVSNGVKLNSKHLYKRLLKLEHLFLAKKLGAKASKGTHPIRSQNMPRRGCSMLCEERDL